MARADDQRGVVELLSQALVALTIEVDDEFELRMTHRTTRGGAAAAGRGGPWLVSSAMWFNCMRFVSNGGVTVGEVERRARASTNLDGMRRWGYVSIESASAHRRPAGNSVLRPTAAGREAQRIWPEVFSLVEERWCERFGREHVERLRDALCALVDRFDVSLPDCLPILGHGMFTRGRVTVTPHEQSDGAERLLLTLLARALVAFAIAFERRSGVSLAVAANTLRVLDAEAGRVTDLPRLTGVSKEANAMALGALQRQSLAVTGPNPEGGRYRAVRLTAAGCDARDASLARIADLEHRWSGEHPGMPEAVQSLLTGLVGDGTPTASPLMLGLRHPPGTWRAALAPAETLPRFPMVTHRGGFPDGS